MCIAMDFQIAGTQMAKDVTNFFRQRMREHIKDERLLEGTPPATMFALSNMMQDLHRHGTWDADAWFRLILI